MKKKVLLLAYAFSPMQAPEAYLSLKALGKIKDFDLDVLTIDPLDFGLPIDKSLNKYTSKNFSRIYRIKRPLWLLKPIFSLLRYILPFPDRFSILNKRIAKKAFNLNINRYSLIISWSQWHSIHLAARKIKKKYPHVPWIAHMSDPWADNPFLPNFRLLKFIHRYLEKKVIKDADHINFTTSSTVDLVMKKYPSKWIKKTSVIPHCFDLRMYDNNTKAKKNNDAVHHVIRYLGNFYGKRTPSAFIQAASQLYSESPNLFLGVKIEFVGRWIRQSESFKNSIIDCIKFRDSVTYLESIQLMAQSKVLLVIDAPFTTSIFFPSKLVDYIGARKPILAFTPKGFTANLVYELGGYVESSTSLLKIKGKLKEVLSDIQNNSLKQMSFAGINKYSADKISIMYEKLFFSLLK